MVSIYIYSILLTLTAFILIWKLHKTNEELTNLKKTKDKQMEYTLNVCRGCGDYYDNQIKQYESQIYKDTELINELRKENWNLKNDRWQLTITM